MLLMRKNHPEYALASKLYEKLTTLYADFDDCKIRIEETFYSLGYQGKEKPYDYSCSEYQSIREENLINIWIDCYSYEVALNEAGYDERCTYNYFGLTEMVELAPIFARFLEREEEAIRLYKEFANLGLNLTN